MIRPSVLTPGEEEEGTVMAHRGTNQESQDSFRPPMTGQKLCIPFPAPVKLSRNEHVCTGFPTAPKTECICLLFTSAHLSLKLYIK